MASSTEDPRPSLSRAGDLLQTVFYAWREARLHWKLKNYETRGERLHVNIYQHSFLPDDGSESIFDNFPQLQGPSADGKAILAYCGCDDTVVLLYEICKKIFDALELTVKEMKVTTNRSCRYVDAHYAEGDGGEDMTQYHHTLYRVKAKSGDLFAIDLSGAQYGIQQPVMPWHEYVDAYVDTLDDSLDHGFCKRYFEASDDYAHLWAIAEDMNVAVGLWEEHHLSLTELLQLEDAGFEKMKMALVDEIRSAVRTGL